MIDSRISKEDIRLGDPVHSKEVRIQDGKRFLDETVSCATAERKQLPFPPA